MSKNLSVKVMESDMQSFDITKDLLFCYEYVHSFSKDIKPSECPDLTFLLENLVKKDFKNPFALYLEVTSMCNLRCKHCLFGYDENNYSANDDMSKEEILKLIDYMVEKHEVCFVNIMGKEPFMHKEILQIIEYIKNKNLYLQIQTNGTLITHQIAEKLFDILDKKNDIIHISVDGALEHIHDDIRGKGNFQKVKNVIKMFTEKNYNVLLAYTINSINLSTTELLYELCNELGVKSVLLGLYDDFIDLKEDLVPNEIKIVTQCANLLRKTKENNAQIFYDLSFLSPDFILKISGGEKVLDEYLEKQKTNEVMLKCHKSERVAVMSNGDVYLCPACQTPNKEFCLGNIRSDNFSEIWEKRYSNIFFCERKMEKSFCKYCKYLRVCKGGCLAGSYFTYKTTDAPSARCTYYKKLEKIYG